MALSKPTYTTRSYTSQRLRIEFINTYCIERQEKFSKLRRCIGTQHEIVEKIGYWDVYFKQDANKNLFPSTVDLSTVTVKNNNLCDIPTAMFDLRIGKIVVKSEISLKTVRSRMSCENRFSPHNPFANPIRGQEEALSSFRDVTMSNDATIDERALYENSSKQNSPILPIVDTSNASSSGHITVKSQSQLLTTQSRDGKRSIQTCLASYAQYPVYIDILARLETFKHDNGKVSWPHDMSIQDTYVLAKHGFFFTERSDLCRCYSCGLGLKEWSINDDVLFVHLKYSPNCKQLTETVDSHLLSFYRRTIQQITQGSSHVLLEPGTVTSIKHLEYQAYKVRLVSFKNWPITLLQTPRMLADAGFFHTGLRDIVRCYACGGGLQQWNASDQPWIEHARWFPFCEHVKREKGEEYIRLVQATAETPADEEIPSASSNCFTPAKRAMGIGFSKSAVPKATENSKTNKCKGHALTEYQDDIVSLSSFKNQLFDNVHIPGMFVGAETFNSRITTKNLLEENEYLKSLVLCKGCLLRERNILLLPCCHFILCIRCSDKHTNCPICSKTIEDTQKIDIL